MCRPANFMCIPTQFTKLAFDDEKLFLVKSESPLILFYLKRENKTRNKTLKKVTPLFWKSMSSKKQNSKYRLGDQVTYQEGTSKW